MNRNYVDEKECKWCHTTLPSIYFPTDRSRKDGLKDCCKTCLKDYQPNRTQRKLVDKECPACERVLPPSRFLWNQYSDDGLSSKCRTCKLWKGSGSPTLEELEDFESELKRIIEVSAEMVSGPINDNRSIFENFIFKGFIRAHLYENWRTPIWVNEKTLLD